MCPRNVMRARTVWQAMAGPRFVLSSWPWRSAGYLLTGAVTGALALVVLVVLAAVCGALAVVLVGLPLVPALALAGGPVARMELRRLRLVDLSPVPGRRPAPVADGPWAWLVARLRERATWRELGYALLFTGLLWPLDALAVTAGLLVPLALTATPLLMATAGGGQANVLKQWTVTTWPAACAVAVLGLVLMAACCYLLGAGAGARAGLARLLIASREGELTRQVVELTRSRARLVAAFEAERRRIERDLHDGAQQRLVALTMTLGLARLDAPQGAARRSARTGPRRGRQGPHRTARAHPRHPPPGARRLRHPRRGRRRRRSLRGPRRRRP